MAKQSGNLLLAATTSIICLLLLTFFCSAFFATWTKQVPNWRVAQQDVNANDQQEPLQFLLRRLVRGEDRIQLDTTGFSCRSEEHTEVCLANKLVRIAHNGLKIYIPGPEPEFNRTIRPYARREDQTAMETVTPVRIVGGNMTNVPICNVSHDVPAVIFSASGFTGNIFHELNEIIIPLFLTCRHFRSNVQFVITDYREWWVSKYNKVLSRLSHYKVVNPEADENVHCFPGAVVGLEYHDNLAIKSTEIPGGYSMFDFKRLLFQSYNLKIKNVSEIRKPVLILISRLKNRRFLNENTLVKMMEDVGFEVIVTTPDRMSNLDTFAEVINSCSVMVGAHGAGLTNEVFLPDGAVMVQVVPVGLEWPAANYYGNPTSTVGVKYLEYKIEAEESSLLIKYSRDDPVFTDPYSIFLKKGYRVSRSLYLEGQDLNINVARFRKTIVEAMKLIRQSKSSN